MLNPLQNDLLVELSNTHIGIAASLLSEMVNQRIVLSVPQITLKKEPDISLQDFENNRIFNSDDVVISSMEFGNVFKGSAYIVFPINKAKILSNACMGNELLEEEDLVRLTNEDFDVITEVCNIMLNSVVGEFGNLLNVRLVYQSPEIKIIATNTLDRKEILPNDLYALMLYTSFFLSSSQVNGLIIMALDVDSTNMLLSKMDEMLRELDD